MFSLIKRPDQRGPGASVQGLPSPPPYIKDARLLRVLTQPGNHREEAQAQGSAGSSHGKRVSFMLGTQVRDGLEQTAAQGATGQGRTRTGSLQQHPSRLGLGSLGKGSHVTSVGLGLPIYKTGTENQIP